MIIKVNFNLARNSTKHALNNQSLMIEFRRNIYNYKGDAMKLLTIREAAKILSLRPRTLYQWHWKGKNLHFRKIGGALRISEEDLIRFIIERKSELN